MSIISDFKILDGLDGYDKVSNPSGLNVYEFTPYGIAWRHEGKSYKIECSDKLIPLLLRSGEFIALIKSPFNKDGNGAYIISASNEIVWDIRSLIGNTRGDAVFSDVYYVQNELTFFLNVGHADYRLAFDPKTGIHGNLILSF